MSRMLDVEASGDRDGDVSADEEESGDGDAGAVGAGVAPKTQDAAPPKNFSRVDVDADTDTLLKDFPLFPSTPFEEVSLAPGQALYLPAGWWHRVSSRAAATAAAPAPAPTALDGEGGHMAFNMWMHPPSTTDFDRPYATSFWEDEWAARAVLR